ncbi:MAG: M56 family metallopeptidase [Polaribacter sp.]|nr:M56 family metallopeptidase [Polaribacter sp.]MDG1993999.1 M56 family metallopeptidase [Polaribacter sp.]
MLLYLLKTTFCLLLFLGFYHLVLEREKMHRFNRFYLLGSIVFAFLVPSFTITVVAPTEFIEPIAEEFQMVKHMQTTDIATLEETEINYMNYVYGLYIIISGILCFFFVKNLHKILSKTRKNEKVSYYNATVILLKEKILPHTFLKYIFINKKDYTNDQKEQLILTHELAHVKQKHSIDVLFIELLQIAFWFIPIFKLYKKAIQLNHEFLADDAVIKSHKNITEYQYVLLNTSAQNNNIYLASNLNYSLTKKRLLMMTTPSSNTKILLKKLLVFPLTAGFIFAFAQRVEAQEKNQTPKTVETKKITQNPTEEELYKDYSFKDVLYKYVNKDGEKVEKSYFEMTIEEQKKLGEPLLPLTFKKEVPTQQLISDLKDSEKYALWIDKKVVSNTVLNNYKNTDFSSSSVSFVYKNARSKRFPQKYQAHLITNTHFENRNDKRAKDFEDYKLKRKRDPNYRGATKSQQIILFSAPNAHQKELSEKEMKEYSALYKSGGKSNIYKQKNVQRMISLYNRMSKKQQNSVKEIRKVLPPPPINIVSEYKKLFNKEVKRNVHKVKDINKMVSLYNRMSKKQQNSVKDIRKVLPPPAKMDIVYTYQRLAARIKRTSKNRKANVIYLKELYSKMTATEKMLVPKPSRVLPPPPPKKKIDEIAVNSKEYKEKFKKYEALRHSKPHFIQKSSKDKQLMSSLWLDLRKMYFYSLSEKDKSELELPTSPYLPYIKVLYNGKSYYKLYNQLTKEEIRATMVFKASDVHRKSLAILDENAPNTIPIGSYKLRKEKPETNSTNQKRSIIISISDDGKYAISKDQTFKNFELISIVSIEKLLSNLSKNEIENTFVFSKSRDLKKFRSKPAKSKEYQDDIEITLIKSDIRFSIMKSLKGDYVEHPVTQLVLDNTKTTQLKSSVERLAVLFKKHGITNMTI